MSRQRKTSPAEDAMDIVAHFPWWVGVVLAAVFYLVLHAFAGAPTATGPLTSSQMGNLAAAIMLRTLAGFGQYLLPFICLVGAVVSARRAQQRATLLNDVAAGDGVSALNAMTWQQFELVVGQWFRQQGYAVSERGGGGADGGIDLVLNKDNETFFVQCKQWRTIKVSVNVVRELYGVMAAHGATGGFVITSGTFTPDARRFADGRKVQLLDGACLARMIQTASPPTMPLETTSPNRSAAPAPEHSRTIPHCPVCGIQMVQRVAKRGATIGQRFWGCSGYPKCKGTLPG
ncbi:restriction endonuclease [Massilia sp. TSP1-1-2]|uniref:restriction endonuclease n=1 Tax=unclassified Massilia TaxID=2609279 RepID=UPI003CEC96BC